MKMSKIFKEPLIHFLILGALLFALNNVVSDSDPTEADNSIVISDTEVEWMQSTWNKKWSRQPTEDELQGLIESYIREEVLYREGLAMGLDEDDTIIRRRLATKMEFLVKDIGQIVEPTEAELNDYFKANIDRYMEPSMISFSHIYFNLDNRDNALGDAQIVLEKLRKIDALTADDWQLGDPFMLHYDYGLKTQTEVMQLFGSNFSDKVFEMPPGGWQGPIESGYGIHLVYIKDVVAAREPSLDEVRDKVKNDLVSQRRTDSFDAFYKSLRDKYDIEITTTKLKNKA
jgi:peptidyl-prolyl cis-trans isomerase C